MTAKTGQWRKGAGEKSAGAAGTGKPGQDRQDGTSGEDRQDNTGRTEKSRQDGQNIQNDRTTEMGLPRQDSHDNMYSQDMTSWT